MSSEQRHPFTVNWVGTFSVNSVLLLVLAKCISGVVLSPDSWEVRRQAALKLAQKGDLVQAERQLESLVKERPGSFRARLALGIVAQDAGHPATAEEEVRPRSNSIQNHPRHGTSLGQFQVARRSTRAQFIIFERPSP